MDYRKSWAIGGLLAAALLVIAGQALAQDYYVAGSVGLLEQGGSSNAGLFSEDFVTGEVTGFSPAQNVPAGTGLGFDSEFDRGDTYSLALGAYGAGMRYELEYRRSEADVDSHRGFQIGGVALDGIDAGVLVSGNDMDSGITVGEVLAVASGELQTESIMLNGYWDVDTTTLISTVIQPYIGLGIGNADSEVRYAPSSVATLNGSENGFAWQAIIGLAIELAPAVDLTLSYRYFAAEDFDVRASLVPADFEIENSFQTLDLGIRLSF